MYYISFFKVEPIDLLQDIQNYNWVTKNKIAVMSLID